VAGLALTIRKFTRRYSLEDLVTLGAHHARCRDRAHYTSLTSHGDARPHQRRKFWK
jgi:hypothetical protein